MQLHDEMTAVERMRKEDLRARWRQLYRKEPAPGMSAELIRGALLYDLQATSFGGLSKTSRRKLERVADRLEVDRNASALTAQAITPGVRLLRTWRGQRHVVEVMDNGFAYRGSIYGSLSEVARTITGAHWSGPRFFGLKTRRKPS